METSGLQTTIITRERPFQSSFGYSPQTIVISIDQTDTTEKENQLTYDIPVANGYYIVRMHFAETYSGAHSTGARVFDVEIEGQVVFPSLDVYDEAGGFTALIKETKAQVHDGTLSISFVRKAENPFISGIEVLPSGIPYVAPETKPPVVQDLGNEAPPSTPAQTNQPTTAPKAASA